MKSDCTNQSRCSYGYDIRIMGIGIVIDINMVMTMIL